MKRIVVLLLAVLLLMGLCACGASESTGGEEMQITVKPKAEDETTQDTTIPEDTTGEATAGDTTAEEVPDTTAPATDKKELAKSCMGKNVSELYALIGKPNSSDYAPSCLVDGEDGMLYYDGFVVYTTREGDVETVYYVE